MRLRGVGGAAAGGLARRLRLFVKRRSLTCREATRFISASLERRLPFFRNGLLRLHLSACEACARFRRQLGFLRDALRRRAIRADAARAASLPAEARERITQALRRKAGRPLPRTPP